MSHNLDNIAIGVTCVITGYDESAWENDSEAAAVALRLMEMGLSEGVQVTKMHSAPVSQDPVAFDVGGQLVAMRRSEAGAVFVKIVASNQNEK